MNKRAKIILQKANVNKLPSLPHVLLQLLDACHDENLSFNKLATILRQDPCLYARVYSACYRNIAINEQAVSEGLIEQTLQRLGINSLKSIAVTASVQQYFSFSGPERTDFLKQHWYHSLYCAIVAESIARLCNYNNPNEAYITGLLHDIGQLVLVTVYPDKYTNTFAQLSEDIIFHSLEEEEFGTTHQQIGAQLLKEQGVNSFICDAALYHHEKIDRILDAHPLVKIINLANILSNRYFEEDQQVFDDTEQLLGLDKSQLLQILAESQERLTDIAYKLEIGVMIDGMDEKTTQQQHASDELKQAQLEEQVKNIALLDGIHQHLSRSGSQGEGQDALLNIISQNMAILFGVSQNILFLYDATSDRINAVIADNQPPQLAELSIPLISSRSLVADALLNHETCHSFQSKSFEHNLNKLSVVDQQLVNITQQEGIICLPMITNKAVIGALILGVDQAQHESLWQQLPLLRRFTNEVAHAISVSNLIGANSVNDKRQPNKLEKKIREALHEVRNPLSIMNNYLGILSYKLESDKPAQQDVQTIKMEIERISQILSRLAESESATNETSPVDINVIIADLSRMFQTSLFASKNIQISLDLDERIKILRSNANAIKQIYTNLIKNAVEALPENGQIMVYTQDYVNVDGKDHIEISVADDGPGINTDNLPHLFSPVETTKGDNHAGLGLTIVKNLVNELHGSISCRSSDKGTGFYILLPKQSENS